MLAAVAAWSPTVEDGPAGAAVDAGVADFDELAHAAAVNEQTTTSAIADAALRSFMGSPSYDVWRLCVRCAYDLRVSRLQELLDAARADVESGWLPSCQLAVARDGEIVAFETFGDATNDTRYCIFSCTKPIVASAVWLLIAEGLLDVSLPVAAYVPEFGGRGKDAVTVEQVMLHTAGFPNALMTFGDGADAERRRERFAEWTLEWEPGSRFEYHATSAHWVLADLIERLSGEDFRDFVERRVCKPIGLPRLLGIPRGDQDSIASLERVGDAPLDESPVEDLIMSLDLPDARAAGVPGGGGIMRAADLALFYQALMRNPGELWNVDVLHDAMTNVRCVFPDNLMNVPVNRTLGLVLAGDDGQHFARYGSFGVANSPRSVGHTGAHMQVGWADPTTGYLVLVLHQRNRRRRAPRGRPRPAPLRISRPRSPTRAERDRCRVRPPRESARPATPRTWAAPKSISRVRRSAPRAPTRGSRSRAVDGFVSFHVEQVSEVELVTTLGIPELRFMARTPSGGGGAASLLGLAAMAVESGTAECVVVFRSRNRSKAASYGSDPNQGGRPWAKAGDPLARLPAVATPVRRRGARAGDGA